MRQDIWPRFKVTLLIALFFLPVLVAAWGREFSDNIAPPQIGSSPFEFDSSNLANASD